MFSDIYKQMFKNNTTKEIKCNLNKTITLLTVKETYDVKDCSPILKNLHNRPPKVKRLTNLFEKTTGEFNNKCNWWLDTTPKPPKPIQKEQDQSKLCGDLMDILKPMLHVSWRTYIDDLCYMELKYVNEMSLMMRTYVKPIIVSCQSKSFETRWENLQLFGNLREIYEFHKFIFQPKLLRCLGDVEKIAKLFIKTINDGYFNYYVCHSIVEKSSENWRKYYGPALEMLSEKSGIQFQFSPMNQLLGYKKILHEINACLHKDFDENFQKIVLMLDTEKCLQKLIDRVLEASFVHKIMEINKISINAQKELKTLIESKEETVDLFLVPREDCFYGCRQPINIMKLGKFLKLDKISMRSSDYRGSHEAHFFVFERCLIYTVALNDSFLFHGCFWLKTTDVGSVFNAKKCINHLQLKDWYRTVVLETPSLIDLTIELKDKSDLDPYEIPNIFLSQKQLKSFLKSIDCESESQF